MAQAAFVRNQNKGRAVLTAKAAARDWAPRRLSIVVEHAGRCGCPKSRSRPGRSQAYSDKACFSWLILSWPSRTESHARCTAACRDGDMLSWSTVTVSNFPLR